MTKRVIFISTALGIVAGAFAVAVLAHHNLAQSPGTTLASTTTAPGATAGAAQSAPPPAFPPQVTNPPPITQLSSGGKTLSCDQASPGWIAVDAAPSDPTTPADLFARSNVVVIATAAESHGYWQRDDGHLPTQNLRGMDWAPLTATNFSVERVLKGSAGPWLQLVDMGADPHNIGSCPRLAIVGAGWPLPVVGQRYVLFLQPDLGRGVTRDIYGPIDFFPVTNGNVHSSMSGVQDMSLDAFIVSLNASLPR